MIPLRFGTVAQPELTEAIGELVKAWLAYDKVANREVTGPLPDEKWADDAEAARTHLLLAGVKVAKLAEKLGIGEI